MNLSLNLAVIEVVTWWIRRVNSNGRGRSLRLGSFHYPASRVFLDRDMSRHTKYE